MRKYILGLSMSAVLLVTSCLASATDDVDAQIARAKEMSDFSELYHDHLVDKEQHKNMRRGKFKGNFTFYSQGCTESNGMSGIGAFTNSGVGTPSTNNTYVSGGPVSTNGKPKAGSGNYAGGLNMICSCPVRNNKLSCLKSAEASVEFTNSDVGGVGYVLIFADDGKNNFVLVDNKWQGFQALRPGKASFITTNLSRYQTYDIPVARGVCNSGGGAVMGMGMAPKTYRIYAGYGVADTMDLKYLDIAGKSDLQLDREEFLWSAARLDGFSTKNSQLIGSVTCN